MTNSGASLADDGSPAYRMRFMVALRGSFWIILVGVLFLLDTFHILSWGHSWPLFIISVGVLLVVERAAFNSASATPYPYPPPAPAPENPARGSSPTSIVPADPNDRNTNDQERS